MRRRRHDDSPCYRACRAVSPSLAETLKHPPEAAVRARAFRCRLRGADARPLPFPDLYGALSAGEFQGQERPLGNIAGANFDRVQRYLCLTGHIYSSAMLVMSRQAYDGMPDEDRTILRNAARAATQAARMTGDRSEASLTTELGKRGMTVITDVDRAAFTAVVRAADAQFEAEFGKPLLDAIRAVRG